jgi:hypothetical protein
MNRTVHDPKMQFAPSHVERLRTIHFQFARKLCQEEGELPQLSDPPYTAPQSLPRILVRCTWDVKLRCWRGDDADSDVVDVEAIA